ncbi:xylene monooxygenase [Candidatus Woesearchaeota archaeon]|nr:xylene monooxygenase [Candidatus Woesearchaeota archaeon]
MEKASEHKLKIIGVIDETHDTKTFRIERLPGIDFFPGQFFMVRFPNDETFKRAYSIASSPTDKGFLDITMNLIGEFTKKLWECKAGDYLIFTGPYGKFFFNEDMKQDLVLIGGGLGITPLRSIIRYCASKNLSNKIKLIYSVKTPDAIVFKDELEDFKEKNSNYDFVFTITRPEPEHDWNGKTGRVDEKLLSNNIEDMENSLFFLCGPLEFVKDTRAMLEKLGAKKERIKADIWGE